MKIYSLWLAFVLIMPKFLNAQTIELVKDINVTGASGNFAVKETAATGKQLFFTGEEHSTQLWKSDGTVAGTGKLTDNFFDRENQPLGLVTTNEFAVYPALYQDSVWLFRSDGTQKGTFPLTTCFPSFNTEIRSAAVNGTVYYSRLKTDNSFELWKTDGTLEGTVLIKKVVPAKSFSTGPIDLFNFNGVLYFIIGTTGQHSAVTYRLWKSDGTSAGTLPGPVIGTRFRPVTMNGFMYFTEDNALKRTNGSSITTIKTFSKAGDPAAVGSTLYISAGNSETNVELWKSDGTMTGTVLVKDINAGASQGSVPSELKNVNGTLFFQAGSAANGRELWKSNGTVTGTVMVADMEPAGDSNPSEITAIGNLAVFVTNGASGKKLWKSNGTAAGTQVISATAASKLTNFNHVLYYYGQSSGGNGLFKTDLTAAGTILLTPASGSPSSPQSITEINGTAFFTANDGIHGRELWKTNAVTGSATLVKDITAGMQDSDISSMTNVNGTLYFVLRQEEIWKSDGTAAGTVPVKDVINPMQFIEGLTSFHGLLFFAVISTGSEFQLWKTDGTLAGTSLVKTFTNTPYFRPAVMNGLLYFAAWNGTSNLVLWKTDGTASGTTIVKDTGNFGDIYRTFGNGLVSANNNLYFIAGDLYGINSYLFKSDGTEAGTTMIKSFYPDDFTVFSGLYPAGNLVYISIASYANDAEFLWRTDGTSAGTIRLGKFQHQPNIDIGFHRQTAIGNQFYFVPYHEQAGDQLWISDGTQAGTHMVKKIGAERSKFSIGYAAAIGNKLYFTPHDPATGTELWQSDGTDAGTRLVSDFTSGGSTAFLELGKLAGTLLISADNGTVGTELYKYQPASEGSAALRINTGGSAFSALGSRSFTADRFFSGTTQVSNAAGGDILGTDDDQLYKEQRFGSAFSYSIPVPNGAVNVVLHFAETYWGVSGRGGTSGAGQRRFHVNMEGARKLTNYDIFTQAGGAMRAKTETFTVNVADGMLNIHFLTGVSDKPIIAAIEVIPDEQIIVLPVADAFVRNTPFESTNYGTMPELGVKSGSLPAYQRNTYLKFPLKNLSTVGSAKLRIYGHNFEGNSEVSLAAAGVDNDSWTETGITWQNAPAGTGNPLANSNVNAVEKYYELDITGYVRSQLAGDKTVSLLLTNPGKQNARLIFNSRESSDNPPQLIVQTVGAERSSDRYAFEKTASDQNSGLPAFEASSIYPNPAGRHFFLNISGKHQGDINLRLFSVGGSPAGWTFPANASAGSTLEIDISASHLTAGVYLLIIESEGEKEVLTTVIN